MSIEWQGAVVTCTVFELAEYSTSMGGVLHLKLTSDNVKTVWLECVRIGNENGYVFKQLFQVAHSPVFAIFEKPKPVSVRADIDLSGLARLGGTP